MRGVMDGGEVSDLARPLQTHTAVVQQDDVRSTPQVQGQFEERVQETPDQIRDANSQAHSPIMLQLAVNKIVAGALRKDMREIMDAYIIRSEQLSQSQPQVFHRGMKRTFNNDGHPVDLVVCQGLHVGRGSPLEII